MLKNCPFCGGEATIERDIGEHTGMKRYTPACQKCGANIRALHSEEAAVAFWNDRAEVETLTRERDEARAILRDILERIGRQGLNQALIDRARRVAESGKGGDDATY